MNVLTTKTVNGKDINQVSTTDKTIRLARSGRGTLHRQMWRTFFATSIAALVTLVLFVVIVLGRTLDEDWAFGVTLLFALAAVFTLFSACMHVVAFARYATYLRLEVAEMRESVREASAEVEHLERSQQKAKNMFTNMLSAWRQGVDSTKWRDDHKKELTDLGISGS